MKEEKYFTIMSLVKLGFLKSKNSSKLIKIRLMILLNLMKIKFFN